MRISTKIAASLIMAVAAVAPKGAVAADLPATNAAVTISIASGANTVRVSGTIAGAHQLAILLYATIGPDVPIVLLSRRQLTTNADGHYDVALSIAPAYFRDTIITAVVQTPAGVAVGRASAAIVAPNVPEPAR